MKWLFIFAALIAAFCVFTGESDADRNIRLDALSAKQAVLLVELQDTLAPGASSLAADWLKAYPTPTAENVSELQVIVAQVKADPATAERMTVAGKRDARAKLRQVMTPAVGWSDSDPKPGL